MHAPRPAHRAPRSLTRPLRGGCHQSLGRRGASRAALSPHTWTRRPLLFSAPSTRPDGVPAPFPISVPALLHERLPAWQVSSPGLQLPWDSQLSDPGIKAPAPARTPGCGRQASSGRTGLSGTLSFPARPRHVRADPGALAGTAGAHPLLGTAPNHTRAPSLPGSLPPLWLLTGPSSRANGVPCNHGRGPAAIRWAMGTPTTTLPDSAATCHPHQVREQPRCPPV